MPDLDGWPRVEPGIPVVLRVADGELAVRGADHVERTETGLRFHRLPERALPRIPTEFFRTVEAQPSGIRLVARSAATELELVVSTTALMAFGDDPTISWGRFDLVIDGRLHSSFEAASGGLRRLDFTANNSVVTPGSPVTVSFGGLPAHDKSIELWLPHDVEVTVASIRADAALALPEDPRPVWLHYGSSISHGFNAYGPTGTWPAVAATVADQNLVNLGFSGSALLDSFVAEAIRDQSADLISLKIGINVVNHDAFRARTFVPAIHAFLDIVRQGHPTTPLWVVSSVLCPIVEDRPGPTVLVGEPGARAAVTNALPEDAVSGRMSLSLTRDLLRLVVESRAATDPNLHYLDGRELYGEPEFEAMPMRDALHPDPAAQLHIGKRFAQLVFGATAVISTWSSRTGG